MSRCAACPVPAELACYEHPTMCHRAAQPGEEAFHALLIRHARVRASRPAAAPESDARYLSPAEMERQRAAENCPHRDCVGCGCNGCRCRPAGRRPGQVVSILDCLACVDAFTATPR